MIVIRILAIIFSIILAPPAQLTPACVVSSGTNIPADLATAQAGPRCLEIPAGVYAIAPAAGDWLSVTVENVEIRGAGIGKTIIQTTGITLTNNLYLIALRASNAYVHDLTIQIGSGYSSTFEVGGVLASVGALYSRIERVEVSGGYTGNGGNGFGIGLYQPYNQNGGMQQTSIENNYIHDSPATGIGVNGSGNTLRNNHIARIGTTVFQHGFYAQGGANLYEGNTVEQASGYSFHGHKQVPNLDGSGDRYVGNLSLNPGYGHFVVNSLPNTANPALPVGAALTRNVIISGNTLRNTAGHRSPAGIWINGVPAIVSGNILEDIFVTTGSGWIEDNAGSMITNNLLSTSGVAPDGAVNYSMIRVTGTTGATVSNNRIANGQYGIGIRATGARHSITGNTILNTSTPGAEALNISGDMLLVTGNRLESTGGGYALAIGGALTNVTFSGNYLKRTGDLCNLNLAGVTGRFYNNMFDGTFRYSGAAPGLIQ